jgi:ABC-type nitrate/sulfonate/bicarbonate transport system permease component
MKTPGKRILVEVLWFAWLPVLALVAVWVLSGLSTSFYFPPASTVLEQTWTVWFVDGGIVTDLWPSFLRLLFGFLIAVVIGVALGVLLGLVRPLESAVRPLTDAARAIPGAALMPIAMMFFGLGQEMKLAMIAFISMWPIFLNTLEGVRSVDPTLRNVMSTFRISKWDRFAHVFLPQAAPQVFAGARIGLAISIAVMIVVEMFGTPGGIGYFIRHAQQTFRIVDMWTGLVILGIFGYLINVLYRMFEKRVLHWYHAMIAQTQGASA